MKWLGVILLSLDEMLVFHKVATNWTYLHLNEKRDLIIAQEHNPVALQGLEPGPLKPMFPIMRLDKL